MSEATAIVALVVLAVGLVFALIVLWRRPAGPISAAALSDGDTAREFPAALDQRAECPPEAIAQIFGSGDLSFIRRKGSDRLRRAFQRDRREIALQWVWGAFDETHQVMTRHFRMVRSSPDLSVTLELKLVAEFLLHQTMCLTLVGALRLAGPSGLARLAGAVGNLRHQVGTVIQSFPEPVSGDFTKGGGLQSPS